MAACCPWQILFWSLCIISEWKLFFSNTPLPCFPADISHCLQHHCSCFYALIFYVRAKVLLYSRVNMHVTKRHYAFWILLLLPSLLISYHLVKGQHANNIMLPCVHRPVACFVTKSLLSGVCWLDKRVASLPERHTLHYKQSPWIMRLQSHTQSSEPSGDGVVLSSLLQFTVVPNFWTFLAIWM